MSTSGHVSYLPMHSGDGYCYGGGILVTFGDRTIRVADADPTRGFLQEDRALANLLAAAPALLALAKRMLAAWEAIELDEIRAVIARAEGRA